MTIDPVLGETDWHGDEENIAAENFYRGYYKKHFVIQAILKEINAVTDLNSTLYNNYKWKCIELNNWVDYQINLNKRLWVSNFWRTLKKTSFYYSRDPVVHYQRIVDAYFNYENFRDNNLLFSGYYAKLLSGYIDYIYLLSLARDEDVKQTLDSNIGSLMLKLENGDSNVFQALIAFLPELLERYDLKE